MSVDPPGSVPRPLDGVTVVDLTSNIAGPSATLVLADLGARVIKVEPPGGDASRAWTPQADGIATVFSAFNRGKESIIIDGKRPEGRDLLHRLIVNADVFIESMRPGKAGALGLGWDELHALNPALIYCSINAFGDVGPMAGVAGFDAIIQAYSGLMHLTGYPDGDPARVGGAVIDVGTGMWSALGILAALLQRQRDGCGRQVPVTMLGTAVGFMMHHLTSTRLAGVEPQRLGTAQHNFAPYQAVRTADQMVMLGINSDVMWLRAAAMLGDADLGRDARFATNTARMTNRTELIAALEALTEALPASEVVARLTQADVPASEVRTLGALAIDPQLDALGMWGTTPRGSMLPRTPIADICVPIGDVPDPGEQTWPILHELGFSELDATTLEATGIVAAAPRVHAAAAI